MAKQNLYYIIGHHLCESAIFLSPILNLDISILI